MGLFRSFTGSVRMEATSADCAAFIHRLNEKEIPVRNIQVSDEISVCFTIFRRDLMSVMEIAERKGEKLKIINHQGLFWPLISLKNRLVLISGLTILLFLGFFLPSRILFVTVEGNGQIATNKILEAAENAGVCFGASRRDVRSEKVKNLLLDDLPELQWAGVNTYGCTAVVSVRERAEPLYTHDMNTVSNLVAACDGIITSCVTTNGTPHCSAGQAVRKGQMLISGNMDCGGVITTGRAQGEVFAETRHVFTCRMPLYVNHRTQQEDVQYKISVQFGKKRINFYKGSGIYDTSCVKMISQYHLTLPGGYRLPVSLTVETLSDYQLELGTHTQTEVAQLLSEYAKDYLQQHQIALTVRDAQEVFRAEEACYTLTGHYICSEMIAREQCEQIGEIHGKAN